jgi:hypothetical protein
VTHKDIAEIVSAALGMLGGLALALPFFLDFRSRQRRADTMRQTGRTEVTGENIQDVFRELDRGQLNVILFPDPNMALLSAVGCGALILSFIALIISKFL